MYLPKSGIENQVPKGDKKVQNLKKYKKLLFFSIFRKWKKYYKLKCNIKNV